MPEWERQRRKRLSRPRRACVVSSRCPAKPRRSEQIERWRHEQRVVLKTQPRGADQESDEMHGKNLKNYIFTIQMFCCSRTNNRATAGFFLSNMIIIISNKWL